MDQSSHGGGTGKNVENHLRENIEWIIIQDK